MPRCISCSRRSSSAARLSNSSCFRRNSSASHCIPEADVSEDGWSLAGVVAAFTMTHQTHQYTLSGRPLLSSQQSTQSCSNGRGRYWLVGFKLHSQHDKATVHHALKNYSLSFKRKYVRKLQMMMHVKYRTQNNTTNQRTNAAKDLHLLWHPARKWANTEQMVIYRRVKHLPQPPVFCYFSQCKPVITNTFWFAPIYAICWQSIKSCKWDSDWKL